MSKRIFKIWRGTGDTGQLVEYAVEVDAGMVILDIVHKVQEEHSNDLAAR